MSCARRQVAVLACAVATGAARAMASEPRAVELVLPEATSQSGGSLGGRVVIAAVVCVLGAALIWWGVRGTALATRLREWIASRVRGHAQDGRAHQPLSPRDLRRIARACGVGPSEQRRLEEIAREMGLASPVGLFVLPHAAQLHEPNPAAGATRRRR